MQNAALEMELLRRRRLNRSLALGVVDSIDYITPRTSPRQSSGPKYGWLMTLIISVGALALFFLSEVLRYA